MDSKTKLIPDYLTKCDLDFDGISVKLAKVKPGMYSISVDPGNINLDPYMLPNVYCIPDTLRIEKSSDPTKDWFVGVDVLYFSNGDVFNIDVINRILHNIQEGGKKLKEINADNAIRFSLPESSGTYTFQDVDIIIIKKCTHSISCSDDCKYAIIIDSDLKFTGPHDILELLSKYPGNRGVLEGTSTFKKLPGDNFYLSRSINCERGELLEFKNGYLFTKRQIEYMLFSIKKTLDRLAELGCKVEPKPKPPTLDVTIAPIAGINKVYLIVKGMLSCDNIPDKYNHKEWHCYSFSNGDYRIIHNDKKFMPKGVDGNSDFLRTSGNVMTPEAANEIVEALGKCAQCLHEVNHPGNSAIVCNTVLIN